MILYAVILTLFTVALHSTATLCALRCFSKRDRHAIDSPFRVVVEMSMLVTFLLVVHLLEAGVWGAAYFWSGNFTEPSTAFYFSLASYTTVGYGDVVLDRESRIVGPIESVVGVLMMGWSTAIIVSVVQKTHRFSKA
jgi:voltage-gated potassium channel